MGWKQYFLAGLLLNVVMMVIGFLILVFQGNLPLNPMGFPGIHPDLAFMQVVSFVTNTDLQHYNGEATFSILSQMSVLQWLQFTSAITGLCMGIAFIRGLVAGAKDMGNFYVDFTRSITRIFLPLCMIVAVIFLGLGVPQTLNASTTIKTIEGATQTILSWASCFSGLYNANRHQRRRILRRKRCLPLHESLTSHQHSHDFCNASASYCVNLCFWPDDRQKNRI